VAYETWQQSKEWADQFIPHVKMLLGWGCIQVAPLQADCQENTDLMFEVNKAVRFAVRIRRLGQRLEYNRRNEVTFRLRRTSESQTELSKLMHGWGDYFLYGWGNDATRRVEAYTILNLDALRGWLFDQVIAHQRLPGQQQRDRDGSASFYALCLDCLPPSIVIHRRTALVDDPPIQDGHWLMYHATSRHQQGALSYA
jgi:hypothetical protein